ncbi:MAG: hypothetical protein WC495_01445 [Patescibacteria group bacterium]
MTRYNDIQYNIQFFAGKSLQFVAVVFSCIVYPIQELLRLVTKLFSRR